MGTAMPAWEFSTTAIGPIATSKLSSDMPTFAAVLMADAAAIEGFCVPCLLSGKALGSLNLGVNLAVWRAEMPPTGKSWI